MSPQITGGDALAWALESIGLDTLYAVPGGQLDHFFDAIQRMGPNRIRLLRPRHEQAAAYMAFGHARSTASPLYLGTSADSRDWIGRRISA